MVSSWMRVLGVNMMELLYLIECEYEYEYVLFSEDGALIVLNLLSYSSFLNSHVYLFQFLFY